MNSLNYNKKLKKEGKNLLQEITQRKRENKILNNPKIKYKLLNYPSKNSKKQNKRKKKNYNNNMIKKCSHSQIKVYYIYPPPS